MRLNEEQRKILTDKLMDLANIGAGVLIFGQILSPTGLSWAYIIGGVVGYVILTATVMWFLRK